MAGGFSLWAFHCHKEAYKFRLPSLRFLGDPLHKELQKRWSFVWGVTLLLEVYEFYSWARRALLLGFRSALVSLYIIPIGMCSDFPDSGQILNSWENGWLWCTVHGSAYVFQMTQLCRFWHRFWDHIDLFLQSINCVIRWCCNCFLGGKLQIVKLKGKWTFINKFSTSYW